MLQLQIYFDGQQVELFKDESIVLTQSIQDIKDIQKVFVPFTQTFNVPASKINNKIFQHFYNFNIEGFDARKKTPSELHLNYKLFKKGKIKLEGVQLKNNEPHTYKLTFYGDTINLKDVVGEDKLSALDQLGKYSFDWTDTNISTYMANGLDVVTPTGTMTDAVIVPLITHTARLLFDSNSAVVNTDTIKNINPAAGTSTSYGVPYSQLKPAIRLLAIIQAIEIEYGLTFSTDFFNETNTAFFNLYMWMHNKEGDFQTNQDAQYQGKNITNVVDDKQFFTGFKNASYSSFLDDIIARDYYKGKNNSKIFRKMNVTVVPSGGAVYTLVIKKDGQEFQRFEGLTGTTSLGQSATLKNKDWLEHEDGVFTFFIETEAVSSYTITVELIVDKKGTLLSRPKGSFQLTAAKTSDDPANPLQLVPDIKVIDFITGIFKMFNLTAFQDNNGIIQVKTLDDFYSSSTTVHDITPFVDKTETITDAVLPFKEIDFGYEGTESFLANNHYQIANTKWGALDYEAPNKFDGKVYNIELPFEHFKYEHLFIQANNVVSVNDSGVQYGYSVDESQNPYLGKPLIFYATKSTATIRTLNLANTAGASVANPYIPLNCEDKGSTYLAGKQSLNFNAEFDEFSRQVNQVSLFKTYYETYVKDMFDLRKRLTSVKAYLPMNIIFKLNLADKFILNNNEYRINKISTNFETEQSSLELTNIFEEPVFKTLKVLQDNCLTVDTTTITADTIDVKVDSGCDNQFTLPSIKTGIPSATVNNPASVFTDTSLTVTPPTIAVDQIPVSTTTKVFFSHQITAIGKVGNTQKLDEYGYLYSTSLTNLSSTDDIDTLKAFGDVTTVPFTPTLAVIKVLLDNGLSVKSTYEKAGLTHPAILYYRFYARTNTDVQNDKADAISSVVSASTVPSAVSQYNNANGENLVGVAGSTGYLTDTSPLSLSKSNFQNYGGEDQEGFIIRHTYNLTVETAEQIIEWLTSQASPAVDTYYDISHTFKALDRFGANNSSIFNMSNKTNAKVKYHMFLNAYPVVMIKGGTVTGTLATGVTGSYPIGDGNGDLQSTS
jgi:hypothetical protein